MICFPLIQLDVILGMNLLDFNHVHINCFDKTVLFHKSKESNNSRFIFSNQVEMSLKKDDNMFVMFTSLRVESKVVIVDLLIVCEFPDVFPEDINDFLTECKMEFSIDLIPSTRPV